MNRYFRLILAVLVVACAPSIVHATVTADRVSALMTKAQDNGRVRVIVRVHNRSVAEALLGSQAAIAAQRAQNAGDLAQVAATAGAHGQVYSEAPFQTLPAAVMEVDADALASLRDNGAVLSITEDKIHHPRYSSTSVTLIGAPTVWADGYTGSGQAIAILDSGVDSTHPFLGGRVVAEACFSTTSTSDGATTLCPNGATSQTGTGAGVNCSLSLTTDCEHGTHVAGIAAGYQSTSFSGVAPGASIISIQVFSLFTGSECQGTGSSTCIASYTSDEIQALEYVYQLRSSYSIASVNMSLGGSSYTSQASCDSDYDTEKAAIDNLRYVGIATAIAAGNDSTYNVIDAPGCISSAFSVGSTTVSDTFSSFSDIASFLSYLAPGSNITSSIPGGGYAVMSGTSMATPHVAGAFALLKSARPNDTLDQIARALTQGGKSLSLTLAQGNTTYSYTKPRISVSGALSTIDSLAALPETGWWWNPSYPGVGYFIETHNSNLYFADLLYAASGAPTWSMSLGGIGNTSYSGSLLSCSGGQTLSGSYHAASCPTSLGSMTLTTSGARNATLVWPGGTLALQRYSFGSSGATTTRNSFTPESGWWWDAAASGTGWVIETQGSELFLGGLLYDSSGNPVWYSSLGAMTDDYNYTGRLTESAGGQTLTGSWQPVTSTQNVGSVTLQFSSTESANLTLPNGSVLPLTRYRF
ncbi:MAG: S8 family serine peptidase [Azospirillaceae bacterium]|nr:S8 family serine peptidase [Azospirillaceae bacterium]